MNWGSSSAPACNFTARIVDVSGDLTTLPVMVTDVSSLSVQFENVSVIGPPFSIKKSQCIGTLAPSHVCTAVIQFSPKQPGKFSGALTFTDTANGSPNPFRCTERLPKTRLANRPENQDRASL